MSGRARGQGGGGDRMVNISKSLSWVLRHSATKQGIAVRSDGYAKVQEILALPAFEGVGVEEVVDVVGGWLKFRDGWINGSCVGRLILFER